MIRFEGIIAGAYLIIQFESVVDASLADFIINEPIGFS